MDGLTVMWIIGYVFGVLTFPGIKIVYTEVKKFQEELKERENRNEHI